jgi:hypothetical protein
LNTLEILSYIPLLNIHIPDRVKAVALGMSLNLFPNLLELYYPGVAKNTPDRYSDFGIESSEFVFNNLKGILTLACFIFLYLVLKLLNKKIQNSSSKIVEYLSKAIIKFEWSVFLRFLIQNYLVLGITSSLALLYVRYIQPLKHAIYDYVFAIICFVIIMICPWIMCYYVRKYHDLFGGVNITAKWGSLYDDVNYSKSKAASCNIVVFFLRRQAYSLAIVYLDFKPLIQLAFCYISSAFVMFKQCLIYLICYRPYIKRVTQYIQVIVEFLILVCFSLLNLFIIEVSKEVCEVIEYIIMSCMIGSLGILLVSDTICSIHTLITKIKNSNNFNGVSQTENIQDNLNLSTNTINNTHEASSEVFKISFKFYHSVFKIRPEQN